MAAQENFTLLRTILRTLGLSAEAVDDIVARILDFLAGRDGKADQVDFPYCVREDSVQTLTLHLRCSAGVARLDPRLRFSRAYAADIRPYADYCEEQIALLN